TEPPRNARSQPAAVFIWPRPLWTEGLRLRQDADDRYLAYGRTSSNRWLVAVYATRPRGRVRAHTARDMTDAPACRRGLQRVSYPTRSFANRSAIRNNVWY